MLEKDKQLLLKDICARLPYRVIVQCRIIDFDTEEYAHDHHPNHSKSPDYTGNGYLFLIDIISDRVQIRPILDGLNYKEQVFFEQMCNNGYASIDCCKPYLRPLSSMTEDEHNDWCQYYRNAEMEELNKSGDYFKAAISGDNAKYDWLSAYHFDYRGMIEKGLALEAPEGMYNIK